MGELTEGQAVWIVRNYGHDHAAVEKRIVQSADAAKVSLRAIYRPAGEEVSRDSVYVDEDSALAAYWQRWKDIRDRLKRQLRSIDKRLSQRKPPRVRMVTGR
jgi:hypothetical protein